MTVISKTVMTVNVQLHHVKIFETILKPVKPLFKLFQLGYFSKK